MNRACYPWGQENEELKAHFLRLGRIRHTYAPLQEGSICWHYTFGPVMAYARELHKKRLVTVVNASDKSQSLTLPFPNGMTDLLTGATVSPEDGHLSLVLPPYTGLLLH